MTSLFRLSSLLVVLVACGADDTRDPPFTRALHLYAPGVTLGMSADSVKSRYNLKPAEFGYSARDFQTRDGFHSLAILTDPRPRRQSEPLSSARVRAVHLNARTDSAGVRAKTRLSSILGPPAIGCQPPMIDAGPIDVYYWRPQDNHAVILTLPVFPPGRREREVVRLMFFSALDSTELTRLAPGPCLPDGSPPSRPLKSDERAA